VVNNGQKIDNVGEGVNKLQTQIELVETMTRNMLEDSIAPTLVYIAPLDFSIEDWLDLKVLTTKPVKVCFICPVTLSVPRDANGDAMGYDIVLPKDWVVQYGPALQISLAVLKVAFAVGRIAGLPLPDSQRVDANINSFSVMNDTMIALMEEESPYLKELSDSLTAHLTTTFPANDMVGLPKEMKQMVERSYRDVKQLAVKLDDPEFRRCGLVKKVCSDGSAQYILDRPDIKKMFKKKGPSLSNEQKIECGANLDIVKKEGELEKRMKKRMSSPLTSNWKKRYYVLRQSGLLTYYASKEDRACDPLGVRGKHKYVNIGSFADVNPEELSFEMEQCADGQKHIFRSPSLKEKRSWLWNDEDSDEDSECD
jgi:hypothetical protein